jgi:hypothetical protein
MTPKKPNFKKQFSQHLFWDIDINTLDFSKHKAYIVNRVMQYGLFNDWKIILEIYGLSSITDIAKNIRDLDQKSMEFLSLLSNIPREDFLCYTQMPSTQKHWAL